MCQVTFLSYVLLACYELIHTSKYLIMCRLLITLESYNPLVDWVNVVPGMHIVFI